MAELTPMLKQYQEIKEKHQNELLLFRLEDFYELFGEDAKKASRLLNIVLTARHKGTPHETPMCGIPYHALNNYLTKLLKAGQRVAICDQMSDPALPGLVKREVTRVITPGTTLEDNTLTDKQNNYLLSLHWQKGVWGLSYADLTTGEFKALELSDLTLLKNEIFRLNASETIISRVLGNDDQFADFINSLENAHIYQLPALENAHQMLCRQLHVPSLQSFGLENYSVGIEAAASLLHYLKDTQKTDLKHISRISRHDLADHMILDEATIRNLEIFRTNNGSYEGSLLSVIDKTVTGPGGRMLMKWLMLPLTNRALIEQRLVAVKDLIADRLNIKKLQELLKSTFDMERLIARISCNRTNPREMVALKNTLGLIPIIKNVLSKFKSELLNTIFVQLGNHEGLVEILSKTFLDDPAPLINEGGFIRDGFNAELDELRAIARGGKDWLANYQAQEIERSGISSLKVKFNSVFGYYIEISKANLSQVPADYNRKQTLVNAERFTTPVLQEYEQKILGAEEKIKNLEYRLFQEVSAKVAEHFDEILLSASSLATLDALLSYAVLAIENNYCQPIIVNNGELNIKEGRHPVIEKFSRERYVPNDLAMDSEENEFILLTGPNMSGKSSFLRKNALICLLAQVGSYVPAAQARLPVLDRIFTRVGASDNLSGGVSTFMVEMQEAANILNNATKKSLIILDELGRGTSTYDGLSIAWAIMEHIHNKLGAKTLFATHYHELTEVAEKLKRGQNYCVAVSENDGKVVFLHKIIKGATSRSYGIEVARLAGLPEELIIRAKDILTDLEKKQLERNREKQARLF